MCDLTQTDIPATVTAKSLKPVIDGKVQQVRSEVFGYFRNFQRMIRTERWKLIEYPQVGRVQLFDLKSDPLEVNDLSRSAEASETRKMLTAKLRAWQQRVGDTVPSQ